MTGDIVTLQPLDQFLGEGRTDKTLSTRETDRPAVGEAFPHHRRRRQGGVEERIDGSGDETLLDHDDGADEAVGVSMEFVFDVERLVIPCQNSGGDGKPIEEADGTAITDRRRACE